MDRSARGAPVRQARGGGTLPPWCWCTLGAARRLPGGAWKRAHVEAVTPGLDGEVCADPPPASFPVRLHGAGGETIDAFRGAGIALEAMIAPFGSSTGMSACVWAVRKGRAVRGRDW